MAIGKAEKGEGEKEEGKKGEGGIEERARRVKER